MMKCLYVFTEEPSAKIVFDSILPKILPENISYKVYQHQGKQDLQKALQTTLPSISKIPGARILVTQDQDSNDCRILKQELNDIIRITCVAPYKIRIVCKELEAWFLGDLNAVKKAYGRFKPEDYLNKANMRNVDTIHSPNKYLLKIIPELSDREKLPKLEVSERISEHLNLEENRSDSFRQTIISINTLIEN